MGGSEGVGRLTAEDLEALGVGKQESIADYVRRWVAENEAKIGELDAARKRDAVLDRVARLTANFSAFGQFQAGHDYVARSAFQLHDALEAEYERRKK